MSECVECLNRHGKFLPLRKNVNQFVEVLMTLNDGVEPRTPGSQTYRCLGGARIKIVSRGHFLVSELFSRHMAKSGNC